MQKSIRRGHENLALSASSTAFLTGLERGLPISAIKQLDLIYLGIEIEIIETTNVYEVFIRE
jgi:hypothetical protein